MKVCALTMVYQDHWALSRWYAHHAAQIGAQNLFVVAHGPDPKIAQICPEASILTIPRDGFEHFDSKRAALLNGFHTGLCQIYDWVIRTDADELICYDPALYGSLPDVFRAHGDAPVLTAIGFDLVEQSGDDALTGGPVLSERRHVSFSGHYSKAVASRRPIEFLLHGVRVAERRLSSFPFVMPRGFYLAHLKYANTPALAEATKVRMQVGGAKAPGGPGTGWIEAQSDAQSFLADFAEKKQIPWDKAEAKAYDTLSIKPARLEKHRVVKTRALKLPFRTTLPARFDTQG